MIIATYANLGQDGIVKHPPIANPRRGAVLIAVLIVVVLLSLAAYQYAAMMTSEFKASDQAVRIAQTRAAAESAIHYVAAVLADPDNIANLLGGNPYDNPGVFQEIIIAPNDVPRFVVKCSILTARDDDPENVLGPRYGVTGESGKINLNALMKLDPKGTALYNMLVLLPNMTPDIANSIVFWLDPAATPRTSSDGGMGAADNSVYGSRSPPYVAKNGDIQSIEELLWVEGVTPALLFGNDLNRNGLQDANEISSDGVFDRGWSEYFTIYSRESNKDSTGAARINVNDADLITLETTLTEAVGDELTTFILLLRTYGPVATTTTTTTATAAVGADGTVVVERTSTTTATATSTATPGDLGSVDRSTLTSGTGSKKITSLFDLIDSKVEVTDEQGKKISYASPLSSADLEILNELFPALFEKTALNADLEIVGRININTASEAVMRTLPGLTEEQVDLILSIRPDPSTSDATDVTYKTPIWLMTEASIPAATMKSLDKYITTSEQVYRFQVLGYFEGGGPSARYEAVVDTNGGMPRILYHRDLSELGKGFDTKGGQQ